MSSPTQTPTTAVHHHQEEERLVLETPQRQTTRSPADLTPEPEHQRSSATSSPNPMQMKQEGVKDEVVPLWGMWEIWVDLPDAQLFKRTSKKDVGRILHQSWIDSVRSVGLFDTAQGFWGIHDCVVQPSRLPNGANFYMFRHNIPPMYEHEANRRGGKWVVSLPPEASAEADRAWTELCVSLIGEQLPGAEDEICGCAVAKRRSGYKVSLWTRNAHEKVAQVNIGFYLKVLLGLKQDGALKYLEHSTMLASAPSTLAGTAPTPAAAAPGGKYRSSPLSTGGSPVVPAPPATLVASPNVAEDLPPTSSCEEGANATPLRETTNVGKEKVSSRDDAAPAVGGRSPMTPVAPPSEVSAGPGAVVPLYVL